RPPRDSIRVARPSPWTWTCADQRRSASSSLGPFTSRGLDGGIRGRHSDFESTRRCLRGHASVESDRERAPGGLDTPHQSQPSQAAGILRVSPPGVLRQRYVRSTRERDTAEPIQVGISVSRSGYFQVSVINISPDNQVLPPEWLVPATKTGELMTR